VRILTRHPENLEHDRLVFVPALPNLGRVGDALGAVSFLHDVFKFI